MTKEKENLQKSKEIKNEETISLDTIIQTLNDDEKMIAISSF